MNYSPVFTIAARTERTHAAVQDWIANEAPVFEQRLKTAALKATIARCGAALNFIDYTLPIWILMAQLFSVKTERWFVRRAIALVSFNEAHQLTAKTADVWDRKSAITISTLDKGFSLN